MDQDERGVALAVSRIAERRQADRWRLARRSPCRTAGRRGNRTPGSPWVLGRHHHAADSTGRPRRRGGITTSLGVFDAGHCRACARQAGLLDHYRRVQQEEATLREAHRWARAARRRASVALWSSGAAILLAAVAMLTG
jgi:hypothetical protein